MTLQGCGGDGDSVEIGAPTYQTPANPFTPQQTPDEEEEDLNPYDLEKSDPCYKYIRHEIVRPVASCTNVANGRIKDSYKITVQAGRVCLLRKSFPNGVNIYTAIGALSEKNKNQVLQNYRLDVFGQSKENNGLLTFEMKADDQSFVKYNLSENSLTIRQVSKVWKKRRRYFRLSCKAISNIVN